MERLKEKTVLRYGVMATSDRVLLTIGEDVRQKGLSPKEALELADLLARNAHEISRRA